MPLHYTSGKTHENGSDRRSVGSENMSNGGAEAATDRYDLIGPPGGSHV